MESGEWSSDLCMRQVEIITKRLGQVDGLEMCIMGMSLKEKVELNLVTSKMELLNVLWVEKRVLAGKQPYCLVQKHWDLNWAQTEN